MDELEREREDVQRAFRRFYGVEGAEQVRERIKSRVRAYMHQRWAELKEREAE